MESKEIIKIIFREGLKSYEIREGYSSMIMRYNKRRVIAVKSGIEKQIRGIKAYEYTAKNTGEKLYFPQVVGYVGKNDEEIIFPIYFKEDGEWFGVNITRDSISRVTGVDYRMNNDGKIKFSCPTYIIEDSFDAELYRIISDCMLIVFEKLEER